ncbi:hybrid sensor histidine kinase/response regulator [Tropicimonas sediminicola]|uniref:histidine kinase n=1 Tax=Tropicimonas sediminicola TaxID=1031541 RepID=A0A239FUR8_9RHOB|nr:PAS-domain containing protein [Tropicimonas sediminicola]SNS60535.1 PAS domain S-box-containing protein [Tropicimonas sediminicola]
MNQHPASSPATVPSPDTVLLDAIEALSEGIAVFDSERRLVISNERFAEMLGPIRDMIVPGLRWEDMLQACVAGGIYADVSDRDREWRAKVGADGPQDVEISQTDGCVYAIRYNATPSGGFVIVRNDVTVSRQNKRLLEESEALLSNILGTNPTPVVMSRLRDGLILYRSPAARDLFGETVNAVEHYENPSDREHYVRALRKEGKVDDFRMVFLGADRSRIPMSANGRLTQYDGEACVVTALVDLRDSAAREAIARKVVENCPAPILMTDAESGQVLFRSPEIDRIFGNKSNTKNFYIDPSDREGFLDALRKDGLVLDYKARFHRANGEPFWGAVSARMFDYEGRDVIVSYSRDLTEQIETEATFSRRRERLFQNEKLSALGGLLANVAHALNNPLSVVSGNALMLEEESQDPEVARKARRIGEAAAKCTDIVRTYLTMATKEDAALERSDINEIVGTALDVVRHELGEDGTVATADLAPELTQVLVDPDQMAQVVINLLQNAHAAISDAGKGSRIRVTTGAAPETGCIRLVVEDDGPGISEDIARKIFEPYFTTRGVGNGKGVGLTWCHSTLQAFDGQIHIDRTYRNGARFVIDLPAVKATPEATQEDGEDETTARILVVDDEPDVADLNAEILQRVGYEVTIAYSGAEAIEAMEGTAFDCILCDLNMPETDGRAVYDHVRRCHPDSLSKIGIVTGDTMGRASQTFLLEAARPYLEKPVSPTELRDFVAGILAGGGR